MDGTARRRGSRILPGADGGAAPSGRHRSLLLSGEAAWSPLTRSSASVKRPSRTEDINHTGLGLPEPFTQTLRSRDGYSTLLERLFLPS